MIISSLFILSFASCQYVTTIAGNHAASSNDGQGVFATINRPWGVATDLNGNLFVSEYAAHKIRKINATGFVTTFAGSGSPGFTDGQGTDASFTNPVGICVDSVGNFYIADNGNQLIRMINSTGYVTTIAGSGKIGSDDGQSTSASFNYPFGIGIDASSNIYFADQWNHIIRKINATGYVSTYAGSGLNSFANGQGVHAGFNSPNGVAVDPSGIVYVADLWNNMIRMIDTNGYVSTYAGNGRVGSIDGNSISASFNGPAGITIDSQGNLYVSEIGSNKIRMIDTTGYVRTIAGNGAKAFRDGYGKNAEFNYPPAVAVDSNGNNVYVADSDNNRIRKIDMRYTTTTLAPTPQQTLEPTLTTQYSVTSPHQISPTTTFATFATFATVTLRSSTLKPTSVSNIPLLNQSHQKVANKQPNRSHCS